MINHWPYKELAENGKTSEHIKFGKIIFSELRTDALIILRITWVLEMQFVHPGKTSSII